MINNLLENFNVVDRPMNFEIRDDRSWWLHGIFWDLIDNNQDTNAFRRNGDNIILNPIVDNVNISVNNNQNNLSPVFNRLKSGIHNVSDFKSAILAAYPAQSTQINQLFTSYGY